VKNGDLLPTELRTLLRHSPVRVVFGPGTLGRLGELTKAQRIRCVLLVTDPGIQAAGHVDPAETALRQARLHVTVFDGARENPTIEHVGAGLEVAQSRQVDCIVAIGGGSAMDCAKGINLLYTNGGEISDYHGDPPPDVLAKRRPLLPMICAPTTAGTGSEAQSFALLSDPVTHEKMACGDRRPPQEGGLRPRVAILDPHLTRTAPHDVAIAAGLDGIAHAVETAGTTRRTERSQALSRAAWERLERSFERAIRDPNDHEARADMLLGAHLAGAAIEESMLGAAHACANPLTARYGVTHGVAVGLMLPHVVRFNAGTEQRSGIGDQGSGKPHSPTPDPRSPNPRANPYAVLDPDANRLAGRITQWLHAGGIPPRLRDHGVDEGALPELAEQAAGQWTARFNPRLLRANRLLDIYRQAW
jgi:alcohol dehydrogenase